MVKSNRVYTANTHTLYPVYLLGALASAAACSDNSVHGSGDVRVTLSAEETITMGLTAGEEEENTKDYDVSYSAFYAVVGDVEAGNGARIAEDKHGYLADMRQVGDEGIQFTVLEDLPAGRWPEFGFATLPADADTEVLAGVDSDVAAEMIANGYTFWITGEVGRPPAKGGPVKFEIKTSVPTVYTGCQLDGKPGFAVKDTTTTDVTMTLHGDHMWFDGFPVGSEGKVARRAAWITLVADLDADGVIDSDDLAAADPSVVLAGYDLSGNPGGSAFPIDSALEFVRQQLATVGHYKGEGECAWSFEGQ